MFLPMTTSPTPSADLTPTAAPGLPLDLAGARACYTRAVALYAAERRLKIAGFVEQAYAFKGAVALHRKAIGHDLWRAPANLALAVPFLATRVGAGAARRAGWQKGATWLAKQRIFFTTDVARELEWRVMSELLELPYAQGLRASHRDALADVMLADPRAAVALKGLGETLAKRHEEPGFRGWMTDALANYTGSRVAAADLTNALIASATGAVLFQQFTPGALTLGPLLTKALAAKLSSFPLGAGIGSLFYGAFPTAAPLIATAGVTAGLMGLGALLATFSGVLTDPLQARLGLHQRRLAKLVDALERELLSGGGQPFQVRDHYAARLLDLVDLARALQRG